MEPNRLIISCCWQEPQRGWVGGCRVGVIWGKVMAGLGEKMEKEVKLEREKGREY